MISKAWRASFMLVSLVGVAACDYRSTVPPSRPGPAATATASTAAPPATAPGPGVAATAAPPTPGAMQTFQVTVFDKSIDVDAIAQPSAKVVTDPATNTQRTILKIGVAPDREVTCSIIPIRYDPGALLAQVTSASSRPLAPTTRVAMVGTGPMMVLESAQGDDHPFVAAVTPREKGTALCAMDGTGRRAEFDKVAGQVARSLPAEPLAAFRDILALKDHGKVVGFEVRRVTDGKDGRVSEEWITAVMQKEGEKTWFMMDAARVAVVDAEQRMIRFVEIMSANGQVIGKTAIERKKGTEYAFEVSSGGDPKKGTFKSPLLSSELAMASRLRGLAAAKGKPELRYFEFDDKTQKTKPIVFKKKADKLSVQRGAKDPADCNLDNFGICGEPDVERLKTEGMP